MITTLPGSAGGTSPGGDRARWGARQGGAPGRVSVRRAAGLSVDVDSVASHLERHGLRRAPDSGAVYRVGVPRALEMLDRHDLRATFFLIASEARHHADVVKEIVERGHEIGSHSLTHRLPFGGEEGEALDREIRGSRFILQSLSGTRVHGFRPPVTSPPTGTRAAARRAGYRYLAAACPDRLRSLPSLGLRPLRSLWSRIQGQEQAGHGPGKAGREADAEELFELPVSTVPGLPLPYCHAMRFLLPDPLYRAVRSAVLCRRDPVAYQLHAVDFLGQREDRLHPAIRRQAGMDVPLERKLELADRELRRLAHARTVLPLHRITHRPRRAASRIRMPAVAGRLAGAPATGTLHWT